MKVFIAGSRSVKRLNEPVISKLSDICEKNHHILIGDCYGVDSLVQQFLKSRGYNNVSVYIANNKARNNIGQWPTHSVYTPLYLKGSNYYKQKDIAMARDADTGFMIWDGVSCGTMNNITELVSKNKPVLLYDNSSKTMRRIGDFNDANFIL